MTPSSTRVAFFWGTLEHKDGSRGGTCEHHGRHELGLPSGCTVVGSVLGSWELFCLSHEIDQQGTLLQIPRGAGMRQRQRQMSRGEQLCPTEPRVGAWPCETTALLSLASRGLQMAALSWAYIYLNSSSACNQRVRSSVPVMVNLHPLASVTSSTKRRKTDLPDKKL